MLKTLVLPKGYESALDVKMTEKAIKQVKDFFQLNLSTELRLRRVTAPLYVKSGMGINDDLNGKEKPVSFKATGMGIDLEIVQSLAKWKRMMLADLDIVRGYGLYTDMNAIRPDEYLDNLHSLYVDQWDWEVVMREGERNIDFLKKIVTQIYSVMKRTEFYIYEHYPSITPVLPEEITFIHAEDLLRRYPALTPQQREDEIAKEKGAVFIMGIGADLSDGKPHDGRAPDYDDWTTPSDGGYRGLNGDIIVWNPVLKKAYEISSMGIRVDRHALVTQLKIRDLEERKNLYFHKRLMNEEFPQSIGGGIGQSRLCMFFLRKAHIGEIQASIWPDEMVEICRENNIVIL